MPLSNICRELKRNLIPQGRENKTRVLRGESEIVLSAVK